jgi:SpoVK/Ycf46/Vps4 family AAA+-type ATPase
MRSNHQGLWRTLVMTQLRKYCSVDWKVEASTSTGAFHLPRETRHENSTDIKFKIHELKTIELIYKLTGVLHWQDKYHAAERLNIDLTKGILLSGPIGCGKTSLMTSHALMCRHQSVATIIKSMLAMSALNLFRKDMK